MSAGRSAGSGASSLPRRVNFSRPVQRAVDPDGEAAESGLLEVEGRKEDIGMTFYDSQDSETGEDGSSDDNDNDNDDGAAGEGKDSSERRYLPTSSDTRSSRTQPLAIPRIMAHHHDKTSIPRSSASLSPRGSYSSSDPTTSAPPSEVSGSKDRSSRQRKPHLNLRPQMLPYRGPLLSSRSPQTSNHSDPSSGRRPSGTSPILSPSTAGEEEQQSLYTLSSENSSVLSRLDSLGRPTTTTTTDDAEGSSLQPLRSQSDADSRGSESAGIFAPTAPLSTTSHNNDNPLEPTPSSPSTRSWQSSDHDISSLTEKQLRKLEKKGINPALYMEMRAARRQGGKSKWIGPLVGTTFLN